MPLLVCPNDNASMQSVQRHCVEFDFCPTCRGVWLDRGELDKIIERSAGDTAAPRQAESPRYRDADDKHGDQRHYGSQQPHRKKKSLLGELFDF